MSRSHLAIGVDVGGTHITAALVDLETKEIVPSSKRRATVNAAGSAEEIIAAWSDCIAKTKQDYAVESVCMAVPGPFDYEGGICLMRGQAKYESLYGLNVKERLAHSLQRSPQTIFMENDAACFLQGEVFAGAATGYADKTVIGITLGTGLGSAVYKNGKSNSADLWCFPFKEGMAEDYLSTRWFVQRWHQRTGLPINGVKELSLLAETDSGAEKIFSEFAENLAVFLSGFIGKESPQAVVIGGNIAKAFHRFGPVVSFLTGTKHPEIKMVQGALGEEAPLLGAVGGRLQQQKALPAIS